jgi:hypothetical protein
MSRRQREKLVRARADLILASEFTAEAYAAHFEAQLRGGKVRRLLYTCYVHLARAGAALFGLDPTGIQ